uniref:Disease resistance protein RPM1 n=1 Tax=Aegilops tauschii TaxID=37682 RepID=R7W753_AEGTA
MAMVTDDGALDLCGGALDLAMCRAARGQVPVLEPSLCQKPSTRCAGSSTAVRRAGIRPRSCWNRSNLPGQIRMPRRVRHVGLTMGPTRKYSKIGRSKARLLRRTDGAMWRRSGGPRSALPVYISPLPSAAAATFHSPSATTSSHAPTPSDKELPISNIGMQLQLLEQIRARREPWIATGLPPDAMDPEDLEVEEDVWDAGDAEQQALVSLRSESEVEANRRRLQEAEAEHTVVFAEAGAGAARFDVADNQAPGRLQLVTTREPVGVEDLMKEPHKRVTCIVGFGGVGKTAIATALYRTYGEEFSHRAMVTVSQSTDLEAILRIIRDQIKPRTSNHEQQDSSEKKKSLVRRGSSAVMDAIRCRSGSSEQRREIDDLKDDILKHLKRNRYLVLIDDVWSASLLDSIINALPVEEKSIIIVTTRFHDVATAQREADTRKVHRLVEEKSKKLFMQAYNESTSKRKEESSTQATSETEETYFNHLIRRKIIQPVEHNGNGKVKKCVVHDMVLELIVRKASEENFITVVGGNWFMQLPSTKVRRLSIQDSDSKHAKDTEKMNLSHVRSLTIFGSLKKQLPPHSFKFGIVQVLDLEGCKDFKQRHITEICEMCLLKYLSLRKTDTKQLPDNIRKLKSLETLDIRDTEVIELPKAVCQLELLVNILGGDKSTRKALRLPGELTKKMKALQILSGIEIVEGSSELRHLTKLKKLAIYKLETMLKDGSLEALRTSIEYLGGCSLQTLIIDDESSNFVKSLDGLSSPPRFLVALELSGKMINLPKWIKELDVLSKLTLPLTALRTDNLQDLSKLEALFSLTFCFRAKQQDWQTLAIIAENKLYSSGEIMVLDGGFKSLKLLCLSGPLLPLLSFSSKAMPELERLEIRYSMLEGILGAENLAKLKELHLTSNDKKEEDLMTKEIASELGKLRKVDGTSPRIILHQQPISMKSNSG